MVIGLSSLFIFALGVIFYQSIKLSNEKDSKSQTIKRNRELETDVAYFENALKKSHKLLKTRMETFETLENYYL